MRRFLALATLLLLAACGSDSTGPKTDISGTWRYSVSNLSGGGLSCNVSGVTLTLVQTGSTFSGSYSGGQFSCPGVGTSSVGSGTVASGTLSGSQVTFSFDTPDWLNSGTISGSSISGVSTVRLDTGSELVTLTGNFAAVR